MVFRRERPTTRLTVGSQLEDGDDSVGALLVLAESGNNNDPMLTFYRDTFTSQAAKDQPIYDMKKVSTTLDQLLECPDDQRIAVEGGLQPVASVIVMQQLFSMA